MISSIPSIAVIEKGSGGLERIRITGPLADGEIYLHGAHVTHWQPKGQKPVLFMSQGSWFENNKPIRGGVPVIFPWFGPRPGHPESPAHGIARTTTWKLAGLFQLPSGEVDVAMELASTDATQMIWPHAFALRFTARFGKELHLRFDVTNAGAGAFTFEEALHTYFIVGDIRKVGITGLAGSTFIDKMDAAQRKTQDASPIHFTGETDRVYLNTQSACVIDDPSMSRKIIVEKTGSNATVVWNPWINKARAMSDFGDEEWPGMVCVETCNAADHAIELLPGKTHAMTATIRLA